jgi:hypothetical protein
MSLTEQLVNSVCKIAKNLSDGQATCRFVWNPKICIKFKRTHHWLYLEPHESSRQAHTPYFIKSTLILSSLLRSSVQSSLFYPQGFFFFLKIPSIYSSSTQAHHLLCIFQPPRYSHAYSMWQKLKL